MSCNDGPATKNQDYVFTIRPTDIGSVSVTCSGNTITPDVQDNGDGSFTITCYANQVRCPGPIEAKEGSTVLHCARVTPCD